jgi:ketosteroid isomerase-like protein
MLALCAEDIQMEDLHPAPDMPPVARGKDQVRRLFAGWVDAFDEFSAEIEEYFEVDDAHVGAVVRYRGTQRGGLEVDFRAVDLWEVRDGKLVSGTIGFPDRDAAVQAVARR